jgi:RecA-family ATPase
LTITFEDEVMAISGNDYDDDREDKRQARGADDGRFSPGMFGDKPRTDTLAKDGWPEAKDPEDDVDYKSRWKKTFDYLRAKFEHTNKRQADETEKEELKVKASEITSLDTIKMFWERLGWNFVERYDYDGGGKEIVFASMRFHYYAREELKKFIVAMRRPSGFWAPGLAKSEDEKNKVIVYVPYHLRRLLKAKKDKPVIICEGEKDVHTAEAHGLVASSAQGQHWTDSVAKPFAGRKVIIVPDNDDAGRESARKAAQALVKFGCDVRVVWQILDDLPPNGDLTDWFDDSKNTAKKLLAMAEQVPQEPIPGRIKIIDQRAWRGRTPPEVKFLFGHDIITAGTVGMIYGEGATGKSTLCLQQAMARAIGAKWVGINSAQGKTLYISCEDDEDKMWARMKAIAGYYSAELGRSTDDIMDEVADNVIIADMTRQYKYIMDQSKDGRTLEPGRLFETIFNLSIKTGAGLITLDSLTNLYPGNENDKTHVSAFMTMLSTLTTGDRTVEVLAHPSLSGLKDASLESGSRAWRFLSRWHLTLAKGRSGKKPGQEKGGRGVGEIDDENNNLRTLSIVKTNYGKNRDLCMVTWSNGVFVVVDPSEVDRLSGLQACMEKFMELLQKKIGQDINVSHNSNARGNFAPAMFSLDQDGKMFTKALYVDAMDKLLTSRHIVVESYGAPSDNHKRLALGPRSGEAIETF